MQVAIASKWLNILLISFYHNYIATYHKLTLKNGYGCCFEPSGVATSGLTRAYTLIT